MVGVWLFWVGRWRGAWTLLGTSCPTRVNGGFGITRTGTCTHTPITYCYRSSAATVHLPTHPLDGTFHQVMWQCMSDMSPTAMAPSTGATSALVTTAAVHDMCVARLCPCCQPSGDPSGLTADTPLTCHCIIDPSTRLLHATKDEGPAAPQRHRVAQQACIQGWGHRLRCPGCAWLAAGWDH
mgnify:CR=1 FL=1